MVQSFFSELRAFKIYGCSSVHQSMRLSTQGSVNQSQPHPAVQGPDPGSPMYRVWRCPQTCSNLFTLDITVQGPAPGHVQSCLLGNVDCQKAFGWHSTEMPYFFGGAIVCQNSDPTSTSQTWSLYGLDLYTSVVVVKCASRVNELHAVNTTQHGTASLAENVRYCILVIRLCCAMQCYGHRG